MRNADDEDRSALSSTWPRAALRRGETNDPQTGRAGGELSALVDFLLKIDSEESPRIQEGHILAGHLICEIIEDQLFG